MQSSPGGTASGFLAHWATVEDTLSYGGIQAEVDVSHTCLKSQASTNLLLQLLFYILLQLRTSLQDNNGESRITRVAHRSENVYLWWTPSMIAASCIDICHVLVGCHICAHCTRKTILIFSVSRIAIVQSGIYWLNKKATYEEVMICHLCPHCNVKKHKQPKDRSDNLDLPCLL